jgi:hypothetical protein
MPLNRRHRSQPALRGYVLVPGCIQIGLEQKTKRTDGPASVCPNDREAWRADSPQCFGEFMGADGAGPSMEDL